MRVGTVTFGQIATFLIVLSLGHPLPSEAGVFWAENFENHLMPNWDTGACGSPAPPDGCNPAISTDRAISGTHSFKSHYPDITKQAGTYIDRGITTTNDLWMRFGYYTVNFLYYPPAETKHFFNLGNGIEVIWVNVFGSREMGPNLITTQNVFCESTGRLDTACQFHPNMAHVPLADNQWYCVETHVNAGTNGRADGTIEMFVNGVQTHGFYSQIVKTSDAQFSTVRHYAQYGQGDRYIDDLAVGNTRIGCSGSPTSDATPPSPPVGLLVR